LNDAPLMNKTFLFGLYLLSLVYSKADPGLVVLFNGNSSAGKSSLTEAMVQQSKTKYQVVSFDDFYHSGRAQVQNSTSGGPRGDTMAAFYQYARQEAEAGKNIIIDTVQFDQKYDKYCAILNCETATKVVVYCPIQHILKRVERRNQSDDPLNRRPLLLCFRQFIQMYKPQTSPDELFVDRTTTTIMRAALAEVGSKLKDSSQYDALYKQYTKVFGIEEDKEIVIVTKGKYDLVINTKMNSKKENVRRVEDYMRKRGSKVAVRP
jgi:chloramphenicol 3-O-phosphotransferase